jgi:hypothetical protein
MVSLDDKALLAHLDCPVSRDQVAQEGLKVEEDPLAHLECLELKVKRVELEPMDRQDHWVHLAPMDLPETEVHPACLDQPVPWEAEVQTGHKENEAIPVKLVERDPPVLPVCLDLLDPLDHVVKGVKKDRTVNLAPLVLADGLEIRDRPEQLEAWDLLEAQECLDLQARLDLPAHLAKEASEERVDPLALLAPQECRLNPDLLVCKGLLVKRVPTVLREQRDIVVSLVFKACLVLLVPQGTRDLPAMTELTERMASLVREVRLAQTATLGQLVLLVLLGPAV